MWVIGITAAADEFSYSEAHCNEDAISSNWFQLVHRHDLFQLDGLHSVAVE